MKAEHRQHAGVRCEMIFGRTVKVIISATLVSWLASSKICILLYVVRLSNSDACLWDFKLNFDSIARFLNELRQTLWRHHWKRRKGAQAVRWKVFAKLLQTPTVLITLSSFQCEIFLPPTLRGLLSQSRLKSREVEFFLTSTKNHLRWCVSGELYRNVKRNFFET